MALKIGGLMSGLDTESIVKSMLSYHQTRIDQVKQQRQILLWQQEDFRAINTKLRQLQTLMFDMKLSATYSSKKATTSNSLVTATANPAAVTGTYQLKVHQTATRSSLSSISNISTKRSDGVIDRSNLATQFGLDPNTVIKFSIQGQNRTVDVSIAAKDTNMDGLIASINRSNAGFTAYYDQGIDRVFFTADEYGAEASIKVLSDGFVTAADGVTQMNFLADCFKLNMASANPNTMSGTIKTNAGGDLLSTFYPGVYNVKFSLQAADGSKHNFSFDPTTTTLDNMAAAIGTVSSGKITATYAGNTINIIDNTTGSGSFAVLSDDSGFLRDKMGLSFPSSMTSTIPAYTGQVWLSDFYSGAPGDELPTTPITFSLQDANGTKHNFEFDPAADNLNDVANRIIATGSFNVIFDPPSGQIVVNDITGGTKASFAILGDDSGFLRDKLGFALNSTLAGTNASGLIGTDELREFYINENTIEFSLQSADGISTHTFTFDPLTETLQDLIDEINTRTGLSADYDPLTGKIMINDTSGGVGSFVILSDPNGFLTQKLGLGKDGGVAEGRDAIVDFNGSLDIHFSTNEFTIADINFSLTADIKQGEDVPITVAVKVEDDTDNAVNKIKEFVEEYNSLIDLLNTELSEKRYNNSRRASEYYPPLTDEQKANMSEKDIEKWEEKARSGILNNDPILRSIQRNLKTLVTGRIPLYPDILTNQKMISQYSDLPYSDVPAPATATLGSLYAAGSAPASINFSLQSSDKKTLYSFTFDPNTDTLSSLADKINSNSGLYANYSPATGKLTIGETNKGSGTFEIRSDDSGFLTQKLGVKLDYSQQYMSLSAIGITGFPYTNVTPNDNGKLMIDEDKLRQCLQEDLDGVLRLFTFVEETELYDPVLGMYLGTQERSVGVAARLYDLTADSIAQVTNKSGLANSVYDQSVLANAIRRQDERLDILYDQMAAAEERYWSQFTALETALQKFNEQSSAIEQFASYLSGKSS